MKTWRDDRNLARLRARSAQFLAQGLCRCCGREVEPDRKFCYDHLRYFRQYQRERRQRLRARGRAHD